MTRRFTTLCRYAVAAVALLLAVSGTGPALAAGKRLTVGITLHPYYSFVANIVGDKADVVPLIGAGYNPHGYIPLPDDIKRVMTFDVMVVNGVGHDEWAFEIIKAAGMTDKLPLIYANDGVPLIPVATDAGNARVVNPHTFISLATSIQQVYTIARKLGELDPDNAQLYKTNARNYATRLRQLKAEYMKRFTDVDVSKFRVATMHSGYGYLLQEFGLSVAAVIEPRHGVQPTARQLAETIDRIKAAGVNVLFAEKYFADSLSETIRTATGVQIYPMSHISDGDYTPGKFEEEMRGNLETLDRAVHDAAAAPATVPK